MKAHMVYLDALLPTIDAAVAENVNNTLMRSLAFMWEAKQISQFDMEQALGIVTLFETYRKRDEFMIPSEAKSLEALCTMFLLPPKDVFKDSSEHGNLIKASLVSAQVRRFYTSLLKWMPVGQPLSGAIARGRKKFIKLVPYIDRHVCKPTPYSNWWAKTSLNQLLAAPNVDVEFAAERIHHVPVLAVCEAFRTFARTKVQRSDLRYLPLYVLVNEIYYTRGPKGLLMPLIVTFVRNWEHILTLDIEITMTNFDRAFRHVQGELDVFTAEELSKDRGLAINAVEFVATFGLLVRVCPESVSIWYEIAQALQTSPNGYPEFTETEQVEFVQLGALLQSEAART